MKGYLPQTREEGKEKYIWKERGKKMIFFFFTFLMSKEVKQWKETLLLNVNLFRSSLHAHDIGFREENPITLHFYWVESGIFQIKYTHTTDLLRVTWWLGFFGYKRFIFFFLLRVCLLIVILNFLWWTDYGYMRRLVLLFWIR